MMPPPGIDSAPVPAPEIASARATVKAWERLRVVYNVVLLVPGIYIAAQLVRHGFPVGPFPRSYEDLIFQCGVVGVGANVFYCLGPYAEMVITACGYPLTAKRLRLLLFGLGLCFSLAVMGFAAFVLTLYISLPSTP